MKTRYLFFTAAALFFSSGAWGFNGHTYCDVTGSTATGYVYSKEHQSISGIGRIYFMDSRGKIFRTSNSKSIAVTVDSNSSEDVMTVTAPGGTVNCLFSLSGVTGGGGGAGGTDDDLFDNGPGTPVFRYEYLCQITEEAPHFKGFVGNVGNAFTVNGVKVVFHAANEQVIGVVEVPSAGSFCLKTGDQMDIPAVAVPAGAKSCSYEISKVRDCR